MEKQFDASTWDCAQLWIQRFGKQAHREAINRAQMLANEGVSGTAWIQVAEAIRELEAIQQKPNLAHS